MCGLTAVDTLTNDIRYDGGRHSGTLSNAYQVSFQQTCHAIVSPWADRGFPDLQISQATGKVARQPQEDAKRKPPALHDQGLRQANRGHSAKPAHRADEEGMALHASEQVGEISMNVESSRFRDVADRIDKYADKLRTDARADASCRKRPPFFDILKPFPNLDSTPHLISPCTYPNKERKHP